MEGHSTTVFSNQQGIVARVCTRGVIALSVGHTCLTLRKEDFLRLAQIVRATETRLFGQRDACVGEQQH
jgi:hypothetical protein